MKKAKYKIQYGLVVHCPECNKPIGNRLKRIEDVKGLNILKCPYCFEEFELGERVKD